MRLSQLRFGSVWPVELSTQRIDGKAALAELDPKLQLKVLLKVTEQLEDKVDKDIFVCVVPKGVADAFNKTGSIALTERMANPMEHTFNAFLMLDDQLGKHYTQMDKYARHHNGRDNIKWAAKVYGELVSPYMKQRNPETITYTGAVDPPAIICSTILPDSFQALHPLR